MLTLYKPHMHKRQYAMIINHFRKPFRQKTVAVTIGRAPVSFPYFNDKTSDCVCLCVNMV